MAPPVPPFVKGIARVLFDVNSRSYQRLSACFHSRQHSFPCGHQYHGVPKNGHESEVSAKFLRLSHAVHVLLVHLRSLLFRHNSIFLRLAVAQHNVYLIFRRHDAQLCAQRRREMVELRCTKGRRLARKDRNSSVTKKFRNQSRNRKRYITGVELSAVACCRGVPDGASRQGLIALRTHLKALGLPKAVVTSRRLPCKEAGWKTCYIPYAAERRGSHGCNESS
jgi:hypothetical protein